MFISTQIFAKLFSKLELTPDLLIFLMVLQVWNRGMQKIFKKNIKKYQ